MHSQSPKRDSHRISGLVARPRNLLFLAILLFGAFQLMVSLHKLDNFQATTMDLGTFEQEFWKISHGHWRAFSSVFQTPAISVDGSLAIYPLAYGFRFLGGAPFLFVVQAMGTALTAWGLYRAARLHQLSEGVASLTASLFLLYPAVLGGSQFDFHTDFLALPSLVWAYVYYGSSRRATYYSLLLCAALSKNMALFSIAGWGVGLVIYKRQVRDGLIAIFASAVLFVLEMDVLFPLYFRGPVQQVDRSFYGYLGHSLSGIVLGILVHFGAVVHHLLCSKDRIFSGSSALCWPWPYSDRPVFPPCSPGSSSMRCPRFRLNMRFRLSIK